MRGLVFANRNFKELARDIVSWIFCIIFPVVLLCVMQMINGAVPDEVEIFDIDNFLSGIIVFGMSFISLFSAQLLAKDRSGSFIARLFASPMRKTDYIVGYTLAMTAVALFQYVVCVIAGLCFGFTPTVHLLTALVASLPVMLFFIGFGLFLGCLLSDKAVPGVTSAIVPIGALLSGMYFDLDAMSGAFNTFCHILPFANANDLIKYVLAGDFSRAWQPLLIVLAYAVAAFAAAVFFFGRKEKRG